MRAIVIGSDGLVGGALFSALAAGGLDVIGTTRRFDRVVAGRTVHFDLTEPDIAGIPSADIVFICAAMTSFAACRALPQLAKQINCVAPEALASYLVSTGTKVVFLSTSAVFDCQAPLMQPDRDYGGESMYGQSKAEAERRILGLGRLATVVRLTKIVSPGQQLFRGWVAALGRRQSIEAFDDHRISPITIQHGVDALTAIATRGEGGIYQISGASDASYYEIASYLASRIGAESSLVHPCSAASRGLPAEEITPFTSLDCARLSDLTGFRPPQPLNAIERVLLSESEP
ncbi:SDR family oxidoreductase [Labrys okinawensis]|uniref:SDR family oxidoreductase n=1 Tax=Labrys okinawensis TaxID=346911 RepID=UPI0039BD2B35